MRYLIITAQVAVVFVLCRWAFIYGPQWVPQPAATDTASRLAYAVQWLLIPGLILLMLVIATMQNRFFNKPFTDGRRTDLPPFLEINMRVTQNTMEQSLLAVLTWPALALALPADRIGLVAVVAVLFGIVA